MGSTGVPRGSWLCIPCEENWTQKCIWCWDNVYCRHTDLFNTPLFVKWLCCWNPIWYSQPPDGASMQTDYSLSKNKEERRVWYCCPRYMCRCWPYCVQLTFFSKAGTRRCKLLFLSQLVMQNHKYLTKTNIWGCKYIQYYGPLNKVGLETFWYFTLCEEFCLIEYQEPKQHCFSFQSVG